MSDTDRGDRKKDNISLSPIAKGYLLGTLVLTAAIEAVIPMIAGSWLDKRFQTAPLFVLLGVALGTLIMVTQLLRVVKKI